MNDYLKLGSVVRIDGLPTEILVIGYYPEEINTGKVYTYMGINAAFGLSYTEDAVFFDQDRIVEVLHEGYSDEESDAFRAKLKDYMRTPRV